MPSKKVIKKPGKSITRSIGKKKVSINLNPKGVLKQVRKRQNQLDEVTKGTP